MLHTLASYLHLLDPVIFEAGMFKPRWYGFAYLCGFVAAYILLLKLSRQGMLRLESKRVPDLVFFGCLFGVLIGGRLGYVLFYEPRLLGFDNSFPYWGLLKVWQGGMSAHGGVLFTVIGLLYFAWRNKLSPINLGDAACMVVPIGLCFGRIANFINGELYGHKVTEGSIPFSVKFPAELINPTNGKFDVGPDQQLALIADVSNNVPAMQKYIERVPENVDFLAWGIHGIIDLARNGNAYAREALYNILPPRHPSQLYEAALEGVVLFIIVWTIGKLWKKDGMASGAFLTFYPILRIIGEHFRVGDDPTTIAGVTMSRGVVISLAMLVPGVIYWAYWIKKNRTAVWVPEKEPVPEPKMGKK